MDPLDIARWQFGITTVYHFLLVPLTLGLGPVVVVLQTLYLRTGNERYLRMTKFWGKLFLVNFILGVATGLVQEFQFGMAWSQYSRFVGDVFGAPLAMEGLLAFFVESTFLGLWIFGWGRLPKRVHLATLYAAVIGSWLSAFFIIVANSWMQHPVGVKLVHGRPQLVDIWAVLTNNTALAAYSHTLVGSLSVAGAFLLGISWYHLWRRRHDGIDTVGAGKRVVVGSAPGVRGRDAADHGVWIRSLRIGAIVAIVGFGLVAVTGDAQAKLMFQQQPMKMAAAEALYKTSTGADASFSLFTLGTPDGVHELFSIRIPYLLSFLSTHTLTGTVEGINDLQAHYVQLYGPGDYTPIIWVTYWAFRWMIGLGMLHVLVAVVGLWLTRKGRMPNSKWVWKAAIWAFPLSLLAMTVGWIFTEMGRQPWVVFGLMKTTDGVSPGVTGLTVLISLVAFTAVYGTLAVVEFKLIKRAAQTGPAPVEEHLDEEGRHVPVATVY